MANGGHGLDNGAVEAPAAHIILRELLNDGTILSVTLLALDYSKGRLKSPVDATVRRLRDLAKADVDRAVAVLNKKDLCVSIEALAKHLLRLDHYEVALFSGKRLSHFVYVTLTIDITNEVYDRDENPNPKTAVTFAAKPNPEVIKWGVS